MPRNLEQYHRQIISGSERGAAASLVRGALGAVEPAYMAVTALRNRLFERGAIKSHRIDRPVISVGNITTGGTGKTPVVRWIAERLTANGRRSAVLLRGYKGGDEARLLESQLQDVTVEADPDRVAGARRVLASNPEVDVFILDDGFQHRRIHRDFDLVLIDATNPFGFGRVLPRGLLREPLGGLARATAFLITHAELSDNRSIESTIRKHNAIAPIYRCRHVHLGLRDAAGAQMPLADLRGRRVSTFCGIGNPAAFDRQIASAGAVVAASRWFGDHHHYTAADLAAVRDQSRTVGAEMLITTEKDWVKLAPLLTTNTDGMPPLYRTELGIAFIDSDGIRLFAQIEAIVSPRDRREPPGEGRSRVDSRS